MTGKFSDQDRWERASLRVAHHMRGLWEEKGSSDTRLLEAFFLPDEFTVVGQSVKFDGLGRREHVIPKLVITKHCHDLLDQKQPDEAIARFIREHVRIVKISKDECDRLDRRDGLGLRQKMPDGWTFGDSPFARLEAVGIQWEPMARSVS